MSWGCCSAVESLPAPALRNKNKQKGSSMLQIASLRWACGSPCPQYPIICSYFTFAFKASVSVRMTGKGMPAIDPQEKDKTDEFLGTVWGTQDVYMYLRKK